MSAEADGYKLFVGNLPTDCTSEELRAVFSTYGVVTHVHVMNPHPRTGQRCAFVFYATRSAGEDACEVLDNQYKIRSDASQPIVVRWSKDSTQEKPREKVSQGQERAAEDGYKLFVGSLPPDCTSEELRAVFSTYGVVTHVHVMNPHPRSGQRCAFVFYTTKSAGDDACKVLDNQYKIRSDASQPIVVRWSKEPTKEFRPKESFAPAGHWEKGSQEKGSWGKGWEDDGWGWEWIGQSSKGSKGSWQGDGWSKGWSFREDGKGKAAKGPPPSYGKGWNKGYDGYEDVGWSWDWDNGKGKGSKGSWQGDGWSKGWSFREDGKGKAAKGPPPYYGKGWNKGYDDYEDVGLDATGTKLYVANLPEDIQESALEYVFGTYGTVEKVHVMRGKVKNGCISGFVEFEKPDEATTAIMSLDNKYEIRAGYGPLQVRLANATRKY